MTLMIKKTNKKFMKMLRYLMLLKIDIIIRIINDFNDSATQI